MTIAGVILGSISGLVFVVRMAFAAEKSTPQDAAAVSGEKKDSESRGA
jgi:hypothetical protein